LRESDRGDFILSAFTSERQNAEMLKEKRSLDYRVRFLSSDQDFSAIIAVILTIFTEYAFYVAFSEVKWTFINAGRSCNLLSLKGFFPETPVDLSD
jgi:hypothetical protein